MVGWMPPKTMGRSNLVLMVAGNLQGVLVLVGEHGEADEVGIYALHVPADAVEVEGVAELVVDVEKRRFDGLGPSAGPTGRRCRS